MKSSTNNKILGFILWVFYANLLIYASFYYNWRHQLNQYDQIIAAFIGIIAVVTVIWLYRSKNTEDTVTLKLMKFHPWTFILTFITSITVSFFYFGKTFLYESTGYWLEFNRSFLVLSIPVFIYILLSLSILDMFKSSIESKTEKVRSRTHYFVLFTIQILILGVYFYGLNPGNMSYDTYNQVSQLKGIIPFNTWHPIGHTLFIGLLLKIWNNYSIITIFQILFFAAVTSAFYTTLLKNKIKWQIIYVTAIVMSLIPSTGVNVVTQWKDIPFTVGLLWGTLILFRMSLDKSYFSKISHIIEFIFCLLSISLFRFNGILAFVVMLFFALIYVVKNQSKIQKKYFYISAISIMIVFFAVNNLVPGKLGAVPNPPGMKLRPIYQGLAAIYVRGEEDELSPQSRNLIESVCTPRQMHEYYNPYFADTISSNTPEFLINLSKINTSDALKMYIEAIITHPEVVMGDKFNLATTMWSVTKDQFSYNNAYTTIIQREMIDEFGVHRVNNLMTNAVEKIASDTFYENYLINTLVWRPGFFLSLEFILIHYLIVHKDKRLILFIPLICNAIIVFLTMPAQDYRYLWFISLIFPFIVLACLAKLPKENQNIYIERRNNLD